MSRVPVVLINQIPQLYRSTIRRSKDFQKRALYRVHPPMAHILLEKHWPTNAHTGQTKA